MVQYPFLYTRSIKCFQHPMAYKNMKSAFLKIKVWPNWANYDQILGQSLATKLNLSKFKNLNSLKVHEYQVLSKKVKNCDLYTFYNPLKLKVNSVPCVEYIQLDVPL